MVVISLLLALDKCATSFWPLFSDDKSNAIQISAPLYVMCHFFLAAFKIFLSLAFRSLTMMYFDMDFFGIFGTFSAY